MLHKDTKGHSPERSQYVHLFVIDNTFHLLSTYKKDTILVSQRDHNRLPFSHIFKEKWISEDTASSEKEVTSLNMPFTLVVQGELPRSQSAEYHPV
jgi:hypothetical protein